MKKTMMLMLALLCGAVAPSVFGAVRGESTPVAINTIQDPVATMIIWNAAWVGGNANATVVIKDNGTEVKRATGTGQFTWTPSTVGPHTLTYTTYINGTAQSEVYSVTVYSEWKYTVASGKATITATTHMTGNVTIPGTLNGYTVTGIGDNAFRDCHDLERVTIPSTVTRIGNGAFRSCDYLDNVVIPDSVTEIGDSAFYECSYIQNLLIGTGVKTVGNYAFYGCSSLQRVSFPGNALTSIGYGAFSGNWRMVSVNLPGSVTSIGSYAFSGCSGLTEVGVPSRWTMQYLFPAAYAKLESVAVPAGPTAVVDNMFSGCTALETVTLPSGITAIGANAFKNCTSLATLGVPASVTSIGSAAFSGSSVSAVYYLCQQAPSCASDAFTSSPADLTHFVLEGSKGWDGVATSRVLPQKWQGRAIEHFKQSDCAYNITIRFYAGGGSGSMANVNVNADLCANSTRYTLPACRFTRSGFAFAG
ncbi:MAG: leucine-rich repeat domain-containing protein, partial [Kiritimatiellae bacterium]|nr:leucine-rich repeat domain-containing protein [Kiritimatiellia bacterium]